jgi:hypothetical protein
MMGTETSDPRQNDRYKFKSFGDNRKRRYSGEIATVDRMSAQRTYMAASSPTVSNDGYDSAGIGQVFEPADLWIVETSGYVYLCKDNSQGAADWEIVAKADRLKIGTTFVRIGDITSGNYTEFENDGTVKFVGDATVWKDINLGGGVFGSPPGLQPSVVQFVDEGGTNTGIYTAGFAATESISGSFELQHDYMEGTDLYFHIHWQGTAAPTGTDNVQWQLDYTVSKTGETLDAATDISVETGFDTQYQFMFSSFPVITGTNFTIGNQFLFTLTRIAASANEYGGNALLATTGIHYQLDTSGSRSMITK